MRKLDLDEIKKREINILEYIDAVCKKNNIEYYVAYGTLLGAIRHHGFIPWDDDIDIFVPRPYYEKLKKIIIEENTYGVESWELTQKYYFDYCKIYDRDTTIQEHTNVIRSTNGLFVDVFPLDGFGNDLLEVKKRLKKAQKIKLKFKYANTKKLELRNVRGFFNKIKKMLVYTYSKLNMLLFNFEKIMKKYEKNLRKYSYFESKYIAYVDMDGGFMPISKVYQKEWFVGEKRTEKFDSIQVFVPSLAEQVLQVQFGETYMELPPEDKRVSHCIEAYCKK